MNCSSRIAINELLSSATVVLDLRAKNRDEVLLELVSRVPEIAGQPELQQKLFRALQEREQLHSTGIGDGIALPHARNALVGLVEKPAIVFGRHTAGVPFGAIDGQPSRLFFLLVAPTVTEHLAMLARISRLLRDVKLRQFLLQVDTAPMAISAVREAEAKLA
jgi:mannitol/fructose-specific phosphotransferase system IIA component (Ntr-type)